MRHVVLIGGATGREHAIAKHFARTKKYRLSVILWAENLFVRDLCNGEYHVIDLNDIDRVFNKIMEILPDYVIVGQGEVIQRGLKNMLNRVGIKCIAPTKEAAKIEGSKTYLRDLLSQKAPDLNPKYKDFFKYSDKIKNYIQTFDDKVVIKCDGVIAGPRVRIYELPEQLEEAVRNAERWIKDYGHIIVEEYIKGHEIAIMSFSDGVHLLHTPPFKNHKRINNGNVGENTSGMGTIICDFSYMTEEIIKKLHAITEMILEECNKSTDDLFIGSLYGEFLVCGNDIKVIEYNCRFGNPSSINMLAIMNVNFSEICEHILEGTIDKLNNVWSNRVCISAYIVPEKYMLDKEYVGTDLDFSRVDSELLYVGNVAYRDGRCILKNSRALAVCAVGDTINETREKVYSELQKIEGKIHYRTDIGLWEC